MISRWRVIKVESGFLKFRVYSVNELNAQEKDRDKWNYVTVSAKTKGT